MARPVKPGAEWVRFRPSPELRRLIEQAAERERRTISAVVSMRLERSLAQDGERLARTA